MAHKSIDSTFLHYGVQKSDMEIIEQACRDHEIDPEWLKDEILKPYNDLRNSSNYIDEKKIAKIVKKAIKSIAS